MATTRRPPDFKEFLKLLNARGVEYLLIGGYAVGHYGYVRATAGIDIWVRVDRSNACLVNAVHEFGIRAPEHVPETFMQSDRILRMGVPPFRIELHTGVSGLTFDFAFQRRAIVELDGVPVRCIGLDDLKSNKRASGRLKDLADLEQLPDS